MGHDLGHKKTKKSEKKKAEKKKAEKKFSRKYKRARLTFFLKGKTTKKKFQAISSLYKRILKNI